MGGDDAERDRAEIARLSSRSPGEDSEDPYADVDVSGLPDWWARAIEEFRTHDLRPYRPPRFADGEFAHEVVDDLEREHGVEISFASVDSDYVERWEVRIGGVVVDTVGRHRSPRGYTVYEVESDGFRDLVRAAVRSGDVG